MTGLCRWWLNPLRSFLEVCPVLDISVCVNRYFIVVAIYSLLVFKYEIYLNCNCEISSGQVLRHENLEDILFSKIPSLKQFYDKKTNDQLRNSSIRLLANVLLLLHRWAFLFHSFCILLEIMACRSWEETNFWVIFFALVEWIFQLQGT